MPATESGQLGERSAAPAAGRRLFAPAAMAAALALAGAALVAAPLLPRPAPAVARFNEALKAYRQGRFEEALRLWTCPAGSLPRPLQRAIRSYDAGNAALRGGRAAEARERYAAALREIERARRDSWPTELSPDQRRDLLDRIRDDVLTNLELSFRAAPPVPSGIGAGLPPAGAPEQPEAGKGKGSEARAPAGGRPDRAAEKALPFPAASAEQAMAGALSRDVPPAPGPEGPPPDRAEADW